MRVLLVVASLLLVGAADGAEAGICVDPDGPDVSGEGCSALSFPQSCVSVVCGEATCSLDEATRRCGVVIGVCHVRVRCSFMFKIAVDLFETAQVIS